MKIASERIVTVFNEYGLKHMKAASHYDNSTKIKSIEAIIYNALGEELRKIKRKDFRDQSLADGFSIIGDNRILYLDYTPIQYPFTMVFKSEVETSNTAFLPIFKPYEDYYVSIEKSELSYFVLPELGLKFKELNSEGSKIEKIENSSSLTFFIENISANKREEYSPPFQKMVPSVLFGLTKFHLEGVDGEAETWNSFGKWMYSTLLNGTDILPETAVQKIKSIVGEEKDPLKIAHIVFKYIQNNTRYVSIQLGIGGWKPMDAKDVDRLGYGDCKALANYARALLKVVGVESFYSVVYRGSEKEDIDENFVTMQGNHVILGIPYNESIYWMECTSQNIPFNFQANDTDDRLALLVKPEGGKLIRTNVYLKNQNKQETIGSYNLQSNGSISGQVSITSSGFQYQNKYELENQSVIDKEKFYKNYFSTIPNLKLNQIQFQNDKSQIQFTENITLSAENYANKNGNRLLFALNAFNQNSAVPPKYKNRNNAFEIPRGYHDNDYIIITLPNDYLIEAKPNDVDIVSKFGSYSISFEYLEDKVIFKRDLIMNEGVFEKEDYEEFRKFREQIARNDNSKISLLKS
ncbi:DUF3857 domain-containing protein [Flavobacterium lacus]|nr:DUF3857 domain-containing protein [Flavobacterium lacus]